MEFAQKHCSNSMRQMSACYMESTETAGKGNVFTRSPWRLSKGHSITSYFPVFSFQLNSTQLLKDFYDSNLCIIIIIECLVDEFIDISKEDFDEDLLDIC